MNNSQDQFEQEYAEHTATPLRLVTEARLGNGSYDNPKLAAAWHWWKRSREQQEPDFYWPNGDEGSCSSIEELARDAYDWDGTLWEDQEVACAVELPTRTYRSFLDEKGDLQVERTDTPS